MNCLSALPIRLRDGRLERVLAAAGDEDRRTGGDQALGNLDEKIALSWFSPLKTYSFRKHVTRKQISLSPSFRSILCYSA